MRNSLASGWRVAQLTVLLQLAATAVVALAMAGSGTRMLVAVLVGGVLIASGNLLFAWRLFGRRVQAAAGALGSALVGQLLRWLWIGLGLVVIISSGVLPPIGVLIGAIVALVSQLGGLLFKH